MLGGQRAFWCVAGCIEQKTVREEIFKTVVSGRVRQPKDWLVREPNSQHSGV
jgi:hypothetical protein